MTAEIEIEYYLITSSVILGIALFNQDLESRLWTKNPFLTQREKSNITDSVILKAVLSNFSI